MWTSRNQEMINTGEKVSFVLWKTEEVLKNRELNIVIIFITKQHCLKILNNGTILHHLWI